MPFPATFDNPGVKMVFKIPIIVTFFAGLGIRMITVGLFHVDCQWAFENEIVLKPL